MSALIGVPILSKPPDPEKDGTSSRRSTTRIGRYHHFSRRNSYTVLICTFLLIYYFRAAIFSSSPPYRSSPPNVHSTTSTSLPPLEPPKVHFPNGSLVPPTPLPNEIDWSQYAYTQYATTPDYLCNSLMLFAQLHALGSRAQRAIFYPEEYHHSYPVTYDSPEDEARAQLLSSLLLEAEDKYNVTLKPVHVLKRDGGDTTWSESYTKLLAFNATEYTRVLNLDSDSSVLRSMDELFLLPPAPIAMPRAYWLTGDLQRRTPFSSQVMLIEPSRAEFKRVEHAIESAGEGAFDMEIVNQVYRDECLVLPHRPYDMLSGEFLEGDWERHLLYLGDGEEGQKEVWHGEEVLDEAKFLHFSNWPLPKPWFEMTEEMLEAAMSGCVEQVLGGKGGRVQAERGVKAEKKQEQERDCTDQMTWMRVREDFRRRRMEVCGFGLQAVEPSDEEREDG